MVLGDAKTRSIFLICLGLWLLPLTWVIYVKYERQRKAQDQASLPLIAFLAVSVIGAALLLWYQYHKRYSSYAAAASSSSSLAGDDSGGGGGGGGM